MAAAVGLYTAMLLEIEVSFARYIGSMFGSVIRPAREKVCSVLVSCTRCAETWIQWTSQTVIGMVGYGGGGGWGSSRVHHLLKYEVVERKPVTLVIKQIKFV